MTKIQTISAQTPPVVPSGKEKEQSWGSYIRENKLATTVALGAIAAVSYGVHSCLSSEPLPITPVDGDSSWVGTIAKTCGVIVVAFASVCGCCVYCGDMRDGI